MYKVVIIDDEPIIVEGLGKSVDWNRFDCVVAGMALNGEEGMKLIKETKPDIVFTDIRMPCMDGLTMIAAIRSEFPGTQIAILTGYRDFDYAQRAISLGVTRFLLKPSKMDEIMEALSVMTAKLDDRSSKRLHAPGEDNAGKEEAAQTIGEEGDGEAGAVSEGSADNAAGSFLVKNAVSYIEEHCREKLKLSDVADQVYVSQWHLSKLLNRYLGQNFSEILNGVRIEKAKEMLKDPALRIGEIAEEVGFSDMAHFSRVFKKLVGISANEYRNKL